MRDATPAQLFARLKTKAYLAKNAFLQCAVECNPLTAQAPMLLALLSVRRFTPQDDVD
ncbi:MAG: hypothetical protein WBL81_12950 [Pseudolabrys sp.]